MRIEAAITRHHGREFTVVAVNRGVTNNRLQARQLIGQLETCFPGPIILMEVMFGGRVQYLGDLSIVNMLRNVTADRLPWKAYNVN